MFARVLSSSLSLQRERGENKSLIKSKKGCIWNDFWRNTNFDNTFLATLRAKGNIDKFSIHIQGDFRLMQDVWVKIPSLSCGIQTAEKKVISP